jgi:hypothetical protein
MKEILTYNIDIEDYLRCVKFAHDSIRTNLDEYSKRNQNKVHKILNDIIVGKLGEFAVYKHLKTTTNKPITKPDLLIYTADKKSFDADLMFNDLNIHVKSQSSEQSQKYGISWSFHPTDTLITKPNKNDVIFFCLVDDLSVHIMMYNRAVFFINLYKDPIKDTLKGKKKVLYFDDLIKKPKKN